MGKNDFFKKNKFLIFEKKISRFLIKGFYFWGKMTIFKYTVKKFFSDFRYFFFIQRRG